MEWTMGTRQDIEAINEAFEKAVVNQDAAAIGALYTADAVLLAPGAPVANDPAAIQAVFQGFLDAGAESLVLETTSFEEQGDVVVEVGRYTLGLRPPGGDPVSDVGKYLVVFAREADGSLRFKYDAFNSDPQA
jgi:ketosteroid isomerase-like protein